MQQGMGQSVCGGVAVGPLWVYCADMPFALPPASGDARHERTRLDAALEAAHAQLLVLADDARRTLGDEAGDILDVQRMMLADVDFLASVDAQLAQGAGAAQAIHAACTLFADAFEALCDPYLQARAADVRDLARRLVAILCGENAAAKTIGPNTPYVLVAEDLTPSETVCLARENLLALVTRAGAAHSHSAILARSLGIPALVQAQDLPPLAELALPVLSQEPNEKAPAAHTIAVDGTAGIYLLDPDDAALAQLRKKQRAAALAAQTLEPYRTLRGAVRVMANIGGPQDLPQVLASGAEGVGLLRSEFLYLGRESPPSEAEQYEAYAAVVRGLAGLPLTIRTLDAGADKEAACLWPGREPPKEENPALGMRGIRLCLTRKDLFQIQLRAIYRAAALGPVSIMLPMIASLWEVRAARQMCVEVCAQLAAEGIKAGEAAFGIMIETPAAALLSRTFAAEVDFFSVGTNDLAQYTLAADRGSAAMAQFYSQSHPAVLALLQTVAESAHAQGIPVSVCGALAAEPEMVQTFMQMGYTALSVPPASVLAVRKRVCESEG